MRVGHIAGPLGEESGDVQVEGGGADKHLGIPGPAQALISLRAVGGHVDEIALLTPKDIVLELVEERVGAFERSDGFELGVDDNAGEGFGGRSAAVAG